MGLGGTAKKLQKVTNAAEELYAKMNEVIGQLNQLRDEVQQTSKQVDEIEYEVAEQRAVLDAIAEAEGVDVENVLAEADLPPEPEIDAEEGDEPEDETAGGETAGAETASETSDGDESTTTAE